MAVYKEINRADGSGVTTFYRISDVLDTAETDDQEGQAVIVDYNQAQNKPSINGVTLIGDKTSEDLGLQPAGDYITNDEADEKFIDEDELEAKNYVNQTELQDAIAHIEHFHREIVEALPVTGMDNVLYMVRKGGTGEDIYNEYIWVGLSSSEDGYEFLGTTATDLTDYYKKSQVDAALATKVDKEGGKGLSEQNYTLAEKTKLAGLENYDDTEIQAEVSGLNTDVNNLKMSNVTISNTLAELKPDVDSNTAAVSTIYDLLDNKMTAIRLVEQGDGWVWMNLEGSRLTYAQASAALGHENCMLFIEQLENDGKVIPAEYKSEGDHINVIFKDLDSLVHVMTCGEDDAVVTEDVTTVNGQVDFTVEDEAVGYTTKITTIYGDTYQQTYEGHQFANLDNLRTTNGVVITLPYTVNGLTISRIEGTNSLRINGTATATTNLRVGIGDYDNTTHYNRTNITGEKGAFRLMEINSSNYAYVDDLVPSSTTTDYTIPVITDASHMASLNITINNNSVWNNEVLNCYMVKTTDTDYVNEPYVGNKVSPNPDYPQIVETVRGNISFDVSGKNKIGLVDGTYTSNGMTITVEDGIVKYNGTTSSSVTAFWIPLINPVTLDVGEMTTFSATTTGSFGTNKMSVRLTVGGSAGQASWGDTFISLNDRISKKCFTQTSKQTFTHAYLYFNPDSPLDVEIAYQLEYGNIATPVFEPYQGQRYILNLGDVELSKVNNYQDKIYKQGDKWYLYQVIKKVALNGSEEGWITDTAPQGNPRHFLRLAVHNINYITPPNNDTLGMGFANVGIVTASQTYNGTARGFALHPNGSFYVDNGTYNNLSSTNVIYYGILDTPEITEIEDSTLLAQLNVLEQIMQYKHTYISDVGVNLTPKVDFTYIDNVVINNTDLVLGKDTYWNDEVPTSADLPANAQEGEIRIVQDTEAVYIYDGTDWIPFDKGGEIDLSNYLAKDNTTAWIPTGAFNPATKKYVDDSVGAIHVPTKTSQLTNDSNFINKNANDLTNYYPKSNTYTKAEVDALIHSGGTGVQVVVVGDTLVITTVLPGGE